MGNTAKKTEDSRQQLTELSDRQLLEHLAERVDKCFNMLRGTLKRLRALAPAESDEAE